MQLVNVVESFTLTLADDVKREFPVGKQLIEDELLDHWYVKAHLGDMPPEDEQASIQGVETLSQMEAELTAARERFEQEKAAAEADIKAKQDAIAKLQVDLTAAQAVLEDDRKKLDQDRVALQDERAAFEASKQPADAPAKSTGKK